MALPLLRSSVYCRGLPKQNHLHAEHRPCNTTHLWQSTGSGTALIQAAPHGNAIHTVNGIQGLVEIVMTRPWLHMPFPQRTATGQSFPRPCPGNIDARLSHLPRVAWASADRLKRKILRDEERKDKRAQKQPSQENALRRSTQHIWDTHLTYSSDQEAIAKAL